MSRVTPLDALYLGIEKPGVVFSSFQKTIEETAFILVGNVPIIVHSVLRAVFDVFLQCKWSPGCANLLNGEDIHMV